MRDLKGASGMCVQRHCKPVAFLAHTRFKKKKRMRLATIAASLSLFSFIFVCEQAPSAAVKFLPIYIARDSKLPLNYSTELFAMQNSARGGPARPRSARPPAGGRRHASGAPALTSTPGCLQARPSCSRLTLSPTRTRGVTVVPAATADSPPPPASSPSTVREFVAIADAGSRGARDVLDMSDYDSDDGEPSSR